MILVRCFLYAHRAMHAPERNAALVREIIVGCMFAEAFLKQTREGTTIILDGVMGRLTEIHDMEALAQAGSTELGAIAAQLLTQAFPGGQMGPISATCRTRINLTISIFAAVAADEARRISERESCLGRCEAPRLEARKSSEPEASS